MNTKEMKEMESKIASKSKIMSNTLIKVMFEKYGIADVLIGHTRYAPDGTIEHECAVHVDYLDGRTICITDKGVQEKETPEDARQGFRRLREELKIRNVDGTRGG